MSSALENILTRGPGFAEGDPGPITFSDKTEKHLKAVGATILTSTAQSIAMQSESRLPFLVITHGKIMRMELPRLTQVALFLDNSLFVPGSFEHSLSRQERDLADDADLLRMALKLPDITEIVPRVSEVTSVLFQIMGKIRRPLGKFMIRTSTVTHEEFEEEARTAVVRYYPRDKDGPSSLGIDGVPIDSETKDLGVLRWIVPSTSLQT